MALHGDGLGFTEDTDHSPSVQIPNPSIGPHKCGVQENKAQTDFCKASSCGMERKIRYVPVQQKISERLKPLHTAGIVILVVFPVE